MRRIITCFSFIFGCLFLSLFSAQPSFADTLPDTFTAGDKACRIYTYDFKESTSGSVPDPSSVKIKLCATASDESGKISGGDGSISVTWDPHSGDAITAFKKQALNIWVNGGGTSGSMKKIQVRCNSATQQLRHRTPDFVCDDEITVAGKTIPTLFSEFDSMLQNHANQAKILWTSQETTTDYNVSLSNNIETTYAGSTTNQQNDDSKDTGSTEDDPCWNAGVEGQSWILCPTINNLKYTITSIDDLIEDWLNVDTSLYGSDSGTYYGWEIMRNIANVAVVIVLLVIIFSQLTGLGIDNYGIKKMLPRLIIVAVLINLSFFLCEIAVDLSNIIGAGLRDLFGMAGEYVLSQNGGAAADIEGFVGKAITWIYAAVGVAGAAAPTAITIIAISSGGGGVGILAVIFILLALVSIVMAVLLFFLSLGARTLIIVGCIAVAPLACVCYALPNTNKLFKKWWDLFKAALIIFPVCGMLGGISYFLKAVVVTSSEIHLWTLMIALLAPYLVFFLLPSLIKGAIGAIGMAGAALTSMAGAFKNGVSNAKSAVENTDTYKSQIQEGKLNRLIRRTGINPDTGQFTQKGQERFQRAQNKGGAVFALENARLAAAREGLSQRTKNTKEYMAAMATAGISAATDVNSDLFGLGIGDPDYDAKWGARTANAYYGRQMLNAAEKGDTIALDAAVAAAQEGGMKDKDIAKALRHIFKEDNSGNSQLNLGADDRAAYGRKLASTYGNSILKNDLELRDYMRTGSARGAAARDLQTYGDYFTNNNSTSDFKEEDWVGADLNSITAGIISGVLTEEMAQRVMATNPNLDADKLTALGMAANGKISSTTVIQGVQPTQDPVLKLTQDIKDIVKKNISTMNTYNVTSDEVSAYVQHRPEDINIKEVGGIAQPDEVLQVHNNPNYQRPANPSTQQNPPTQQNP